MELSVEGSRIRLLPADVAAARHRAQLSRKPHNVGRLRFLNELLPKLATQLATALHTELDEDNRGELLDALRNSPDVRREVNLCWLPLTPEKLLRDLYADPARLRAAAPGWTEAERRALWRDRSAPWTPADVALLDEAAELLGTEPEPGDQQAAADRAAELAYAGRVMDLVAELSPDAAQMTTAANLAERYGAETARRSLLDEAASDRGWAFGHVVVDEAQELSAMQWRLLMRRCPSRSMTVVGDIAQTGSAAGARSWHEVLSPYLNDRWRLAELTVNYRTPAEIMRAASAMLAAAGVGSSPITSARSVESSLTVQRPADPLPDRVAALVAEELAGGPGQVAVITADAARLIEQAALAELADAGRVAVLTPTQAKGLEFDSVLLVEPAEIVDASRNGISDLYVAMTRATQRLRILHRRPLPAGLPVAP
jgi:DNA helicase IV